MKTLFGMESESGVMMGEASYGIEDAIEAVTLEAEINADMQDIEDSEAIVKQAELVSTQLQNGIALDKAALESDSITTDVVKMSMHNLASTAAILGADADRFEVSTESIENSPESVLTVSMEEKEGMLKKVVNKIKEILAKVVQAGKKVIAKIVVAVKNQSKAAEKLIEKFSNKQVLSKDKDKWDDGEEKAIKAKFGVYSLLSEVSIGGKLVNSTVESAVADKSTLEKLKAVIGKGSSDAEKAVADKDSKSKSIQSYVDGLPMIKDDNFTIFSLKGSTVKVVYMDGKKVATGTGTLKAKALDGVKVDFIKAADMLSALKTIKDAKDYAKKGLENLGKAEDELKKSLDATQKVLDEVKDKTADIYKAAKEEFNVDKSLATAIPRVGLDEVMHGYSAVNNTLWLASKLLSHYEKAE